MSLRKVPTRFRAYQLGEAGSSFSYFADTTFTLIEARITDLSKTKILSELKACGKSHIDVLHITSWDEDHCYLKELELILSFFKPNRVEYPGYAPHTDNGKQGLAAIQRYQSSQSIGGNGKPVKAISVTPDYIDSLEKAEELRYRNTFCWPKNIDTSTSNDNSTVKIFREGSFNLASLGDVESANLGAYLRRLSVFDREVDVMILAHHGADCDTNSLKFFEQTRPKIAICSSNYDNEYDHPRQEVRDRLYKLKIPLFTTKTGDVIIEAIAPDYSHYKVYNLCSDSTKISSICQYKSKKHHWLSMNIDSLKNVFAKKPSYRNIKS